MNNLQPVPPPNIKAIRQRAEAEYKRSARMQLGIQERIGQSIPWMLLLITGAFFALSAPHTASTFDRLTPGWGWVAPVGIELSLLYTAFTKRQAKQTKGVVPGSVRTLEVFAFIVAVVVNGAGAFVSVTASTGTSDLSFSRLIGDFGNLPAESQVALLLVPLAAIIIPVGTGVAGEGIAKLILERRENGDVIDQLWKRDRERVVFDALRDELVQRGITPAKARDIAISLAREPDLSNQRALPEPKPDSPPDMDKSDTVDKPDANGQPDGRTRTDASGQRQKVWDLLAADPAARSLNVRDLGERAGVSKTLAAEVKREYMKGESQ